MAFIYDVLLPPANFVLRKGRLLAGSDLLSSASGLVPVALRSGSRLSNAKNRCTIDTAVAPPTAVAHHLIELWRTSPAENSPGILVCQVQHDSFGIRNQLPDLDVERASLTPASNFPWHRTITVLPVRSSVRKLAAALSDIRQSIVET